MDPTDHWFEQKLDHFNRNRSSSSWQQVASQDYNPDKPNHAITQLSETTNRSQGLEVEYLKIQIRKKNCRWSLGVGAMFLINIHMKFPLNKRDLSTASLRFLSSKQAVADIVHFRTEIAKKLGLTKNKWVAFGRYYGGSLAVWSRLTQPSLFAAAVGSTAIIKAKVNFNEYFEVVYKNLVTHNMECARAVSEALQFIVTLLQHPEFFSTLQNQFKLCNPLASNSNMEKVYFMQNLMRFVSRIGSRTSTRRKENEVSIDEFCDTMRNTTLGLPYSRFTRIENLILKKKNMTCFETNYNTFLKALNYSSISNISNRGGRQWFYQRCTEFGLFITTDSKEHPFSGLTLRDLIQQCSDVFGPKFNYNLVLWGVEVTNTLFTGYNINGNKVIFPNSLLDPWHTLGITKDISQDLPAVVIKGESFCKDMLEPKDTDSAELIQAREKIFQILQTWLME
ncbi:thymus-specific serine protease-like [Orycteropus afer afer]|uniref:Thymus-specific serine protease-like n=1 Tax=Orycteropus afer afer TaxID=1230840 RepID=A0A8B6ZDK5_ORYAF|nr:thymus-specific serine protease-like [Orycteropus afer afer]